MAFDVAGKEPTCTLISIDDQLDQQQDQNIILTRQMKSNSIVISDYTFTQATALALEAENAM